MKSFFLLLFIISGGFAFSQPLHIWKMEDLEKRVKNNSDTTYVVNFWATWCAPCVKELPAFDTIYSLYEKEKVKILLVSLDFKEELNDKVLPFLQRKKIRSEVVLLDEVNGNYFIPRVSSAWSGALPGTWIVNNKSAVNRFFEQKVTVDFLKNEITNIPK